MWYSRLSQGCVASLARLECNLERMGAIEGCVSGLVALMKSAAQALDDIAQVWAAPLLPCRASVCCFVCARAHVLMIKISSDAEFERWVGEGERCAMLLAGSAQNQRVA
jgi:hypothetical protein